VVLKNKGGGQSSGRVSRKKSESMCQSREEDHWEGVGKDGDDLCRKEVSRD